MAAEAPTHDPTKALIDAVADMRKLQRAWFGGDKSPATLEAARGQGSLFG
jgi:hypothetical protein